MLNDAIEPDLGEQGLPELDEGWWSAVLADEDVYQSGAREVAAKAGIQSGQLNVDWEKIQACFDQDEVLELVVQGFNRGGLLVEGEGIQGFVPVSHLIEMPCEVDEEERRQILTGYIGRQVHLKIIECEPTQERVVLSERAALAGEGRRKALFTILQEGNLVTGTVTNVTDFGVFVDLGGVEGLIHVSELSWGRVQHPSEVVKVGQCVQVMVLQVSEETSRIALSLKRLQVNPWDTLVEAHRPGDIVNARITSIMKFGAFARLDEGVEGLIHISSVPFPSGRRDINAFFHEGQSVQVKILHIDAERRRLGLGLVQIE
ncbi:MAG: S1 RNA-binding domain-containing protein [Chloroflexi bacterium]|jgi:small subunit ribosomal protein S1|nr:S1 RNA-binding domain-containing protein [Chloroflexota bacterium]